MSSDDYNIRWQNFTTDLTHSIREFGRENHLQDVNLLTNDNSIVKSNKFILSASSPVFNNIIKATSEQNVSIFMRGFKKYDLSLILEFVHCGEVNVSQEHLEFFL